MHSLAPSTAPATGKSKAGVYAIGLAAVAALIAVVVFFGLPKHGGLVVTVAGPGGLAVDGAKILVDGEERCAESPCRLQELATGAHVVRVVAAGYRQAADKPVRIVAGQDEILEITLERGASAAIGAATGAGIDVPDLGRHLHLWVDGRDAGQLPVKLSDLTPGEHTVRLAGSPRYAPIEEKIRVEAGQITRYSPALKVLKGLVRVTNGADSAGARVELVCPGERTLLEVPTTIEVDASKACALVAQRAGSAEYRRELSFEDGRAEKEIQIAFADGTAADSPAPSKVASRVAAKPAPAAPRRRAAAAAPKAAPKASGQGRIAINSLPASSVVVDGHPAGQTPTSVATSAGTHTVMFIHPERGRKVVSVNVLPGQTATAAVRF